MNLLFSNTVLLPLLALALVPLLLHLFARARPPVFKFSSVEFLQTALHKTMRLKKPQSLLVLILRTLLVLALIGVFLKPIWFQGGKLPEHGGRRQVVLLVDATASMGVTEGTQTRFAIACGKAAEIVSGLSSRDLANVIWLDTPTRTEFPRLGANHEHLVRVLREAGVGQGAADLEGALNLAQEMLKEADGTREIYLLSDFQTTTWSGIKPAVAQNIRFFPLKIGSGEVANRAITALRTEPEKPLVGQDINVLCEISNFSSEAAMSTVYLRTEAAPQTQEVRLQPWQKSTVSFRTRYREAGAKVLALELGEDAFPADNRRWKVVEVVEHLRVGLAGNETQTATYWRRALEALGWARIDPLTEAQLRQPLDYDLLLLAGLAPEAAIAGPLRDYLTGGGSVVWYPAVGNAASLWPVTGNETPRAWIWEKGEKPWQLAVADPKHPAVSIFADGLYGDLAGGNFRGRFSSPTPLPQTFTPVLKYSDGVTALAVARFGAGQVIYWNLPLQREAGDWATRTEFLPFFAELLLQHRRASGPASLNDFTPGQPLWQHVGQEVLDKDIRLEREGEVLAVTRQNREGRTAFTTVATRRTGVYQWNYRGAVLGLQTVNVPAAESDLRTQGALSAETGPLITVNAGKSMRDLKEGTPLWPMLLGLGSLLVVVEGFALMRAGRT
jgi:hypothetical protein